MSLRKGAPSLPVALAGACVLVCLAALAFAGTRTLAVRRFALNAPNQLAVAVLRPGQSTCEGPIVSEGAADEVGVWGASVIGSNRLRVVVQAPGGRAALSSGMLAATTHPSEYVARLDRAVPGGRTVRVCLTSTLNSFSLLGSPAVRPGVTMTRAKPGQEFSLVLFQASGQSLLSSLPTAFSRASLFRPSWVGAWTFWALMGLLIAAFAIGVGAVVSAAAADEGLAGDQSGSSASTARQ